MDTLATIGTEDEAYAERPTVKAVIRRDGKILLLNDGLLPGGGVDSGEEPLDALTRELREELGMTVAYTTSIGTVVQYRDFIQKKYVVQGYSCTLVKSGLQTAPQDEGERNFRQQWLPLSAALKLVEEFITRYEALACVDDSVQGRLYNLMTTQLLLARLKD